MPKLNLKTLLKDLVINQIQCHNIDVHCLNKNAKAIRTIEVTLELENYVLDNKNTQCIPLCIPQKNLRRNTP